MSKKTDPKDKLTVCDVCLTAQKIDQVIVLDIIAPPRWGVPTEVCLSCAELIRDSLKKHRDGDGTHVQVNPE